MRNLKKVLSLALALVMLLGMMVVGAGAATEFQDADKIQNKEAVAVLVGMGIMKGRTNGSSDDVLFAPDGTLTRAEAAMMIAQMDLGVEAAAALVGNGSNTFSDVWAGYWAEGAIDYCVEQGYIKGNGAGQFLPGNPVSSVEFGSMALRLLGYDADNEGLVGDQWAVKAASLIRKAGLATSTAANTKPMTRDEMAQMAFNTLTAETVEYSGLNISGDNINVSFPATIRRHSANNDTGNQTYDKKPIQSNITPIRFCEERFPTLKLDRSGENEFKEAYSVWTYRGVEIEDSKIVLNCISTTKDEGKSNAWMTNVKRFDPVDECDIYVNGDLLATKNGTDIEYITRLTGNGRLVQVYVDPDNLSWVEKVVVIDTVPGEVTKVASDGKLTIKLLETDGGDKANNNPDVTRNDLVTTGDKTVIDGEFKKGDLVLVNAYGENPICEDSTVAKVFAPEVREEFVIRKNYDKDTQKAVSVDTGDKTGIKQARNVITDEGLEKFTVNNKNKDSVLYLDQYGYIVKIVDWEDTTPKDGLIAVKDVYQDVEGRKIVDRVAGVISNGETIELEWEGDTKPSVGTVYVYTDKDGNSKYELAKVETEATKKAMGNNGKDGYVSKRFAAETSLTFNSGSTKGNKDTNAGSYFYADSVKFIFTNKDGVTVLNGRQSYQGKVTAAANALNEKNEIIAVFLEAEPDIVSLDDIVFVWTRRSKDEVVGSDKQTVYYGYEAYESNGSEIDEFFGTENDMVGETGVGMFYKKDIVKDGDVTAYKPTGNKNDKIVAHTITNAKITYANGTNGDAFIINGDTDEPKELLTTSRTKVIDLDTDGTITTPAELNKTMNKDDKTVHVAVVYTYDKDTENYEVHTIFVTDVDSKTSFKDKTEVIPNAPKQYTVSITPVTGVKIEVTTAGGKVVNDGDKFDENTVLNVKATATDAGKNTALTVDGKVHNTATLTLTKSVVISATEPSDKPAEAEKAFNIVLDKKDTDAGISIKGVHVVTSDDVTAGTYTTNKGVATAGDLAIILDIPTGVTLTTAADNATKLTGKNANGFTVSTNVQAIAPADKLVRVGKTDVASMDKDVTYTLGSVLGAVSKQVKVVDETGKGLTFTTGTETLATTGAGAALNVTVASGAPKYAKTASVVYTVTGLKSGTLAGTAGTGDDAGKQISAGLTVTPATGALAQLAISSDAVADATADNVVITIKEIRVATITPTIKGGSATLSDVTVGTKFGLPQITATLGSAVAEAKVKVSISNVTSDSDTDFPTTDRLITLDATGKTTADVANHYTPTGKGEVKITVTPVITKLNKATATWTLSGAGAAGVTVDALGDDIAVENGANKAAITLTLNKTGLAENAQISLKVVDGANTTVENNTFISAKAVASADKTTLTINAGELTNITGDPITVIVSIINP